MLGTAWTVARVRGIEIRVDTSWLLIAALITYSFFARFDALYAELSTGAAVGLAGAAALAFFLSVVLHELAHAVAATARGIEVKSITLFLFGGATAAQADSKGPKEEFLISIVGPLTSAVTGLGLGVLAKAVQPVGEALPGVIGYLAWLNFALAAFNMLPGLPLDGGRVFRSAVWAVTGDRRRATQVASTVGRGIGLVLVGLGVLSLFRGAVGGLWLAFIGWFLAQSARASYAELEVRRALEGVEAGDVMSADLVEVPADITVAEAAEEFFLRRHHSAFPVEDGGRVIGLLSLRGVRDVSPEDRPTRRVRDIMRPLEAVPAVQRHDRMANAVGHFGDDDLGRLLVKDGGEVVGMITTRDVTRWLQRSHDLVPAGVKAARADGGADDVAG